MTLGPRLLGISESYVNIYFLLEERVVVVES